MTMPQAILDKITEYEGRIAYSHNEINRITGMINELQNALDAECKAKETHKSALALLRWTSKQYGDEDTGHSEEDSGDDSTNPEGDFNARPVETIKDRVYAVMAWLDQPVQAKAAAKALGLDWRQVAPTFGALSKLGKIKADPRGGGWLRTDRAPGHNPVFYDSRAYEPHEIPDPNRDPVRDRDPARHSQHGTATVGLAPEFTQE